jgi:hypothetical protein
LEQEEVYDFLDGRKRFLLGRKPLDPIEFEYYNNLCDAVKLPEGLGWGVGSKAKREACAQGLASPLKR